MARVIGGRRWLSWPGRRVNKPAANATMRFAERELAASRLDSSRGGQGRA
jgi:hypothetical protein